MAQHDYNIANQSGADFRSDLNNALSAIASTNSGDTSPTTTFANQLWIDTANNVLKIRNEGNSAWITTGISITADNTFNIDGGTVNGITALSFSSGSSVTTILDEDNLGSNSATALATQQSIKAYVDSQVGSVDTLAEILTNGNTTGGTDISLSSSDITGTGNITITGIVTPTSIGATNLSGNLTLNSNDITGTGNINITGDLDVSNDIQCDSLGIGTAPSGTSGEIRATNDVTAFYSSDVALKENITNIPDPIEAIKKLNGVLFDWKKSYIDERGGEDGYFVRKKDVGVIAQEVEKVLPEAVAQRSDGIKAVKYDRLTCLLIEAVKQLNEKVEILTREKN